MGRQQALHNTTGTRQLVLKMITFGLMFSGVINQAWALPDYDLPVSPLYQNDYSDKLDNLNKTIAELGCTLTAWTMDINYEIAQLGLHAKKPDGTQGALISYTPADINRLLNDYRYTATTYKKDELGNYIRGPDGKLVVDTQTIKNGWSVPIGSDGKPTGSASDLNIGAMLNAVKNDTVARSFEGKGLTADTFNAPGWNKIPQNEIPKDGLVLGSGYTRIEDFLKAGHPVVVRVGNDTHTVLITSFHGVTGAPAGTGTYDIKDPFKDPNTGTSIIDLGDSAYGNKIYDFGTAVFKAGGVPSPFLTPDDTFIDPFLIFDPDVNPEMFGPQVFMDNTVRVVASSVPEPTIFQLLLIGSLVGAAVAFKRRHVKYIAA